MSWAARRRARRLRRGQPAPLTPEQEAEWFDVTPAPAADDVRRAELETLTSLRAAAEAVRTHLAPAPAVTQAEQSAAPTPSHVRMRDTSYGYSVLRRAADKGELSIMRGGWVATDELARWEAARIRPRPITKPKVMEHDQAVAPIGDEPEMDELEQMLQSGRLRRVK